MRPNLMIAIAAALCAIAVPGSAQSRPWYPWCTVYWTSFGGEYRNCGFVSFEHCRRNASSGLGEFCMQNNWQPSPAETYRPDVKRPRKR